MESFIKLPEILDVWIYVSLPTYFIYFTKFASDYVNKYTPSSSELSNHFFQYKAL